ncbi:MAG: hypothetical protein MUE74_05345 [Bacteroidales bacterium]|nr:hypothetical protein [Bacteroidales bacterium]
MKILSTGLKILSILLLITGCSGKDKTFIASFSGEVSEQKWAISDLNPELPSDWSSYGFLTFDLKSTTSQRFELRLYDGQGIRRLNIHPFENAWIRASIPLVHFQKRNTQGNSMASISKTPRPGYWIGFSSQVGPITSIDSVGVLMRFPVNSPTLEIKNVILTMEPQDSVLGPVPLVDEFGQWIPSDWPGKVQTLEELKLSWAEEEKQLGPGDFNYGKYGGSISAKTRATGFFRIEKIDGRWWFVDPEGYLFYSTGSTGMRPRSDMARTKGREYIYKTLPSNEELFAGTNIRGGGSDPSIYTWNLVRRFGPDWLPGWIDLTIRRMEDWGINTIANWSDTNLGDSQRKAYVATIGGWGLETGLMGMPDVYASGYAEMVDQAAERQCAPKKNDPYLLGYFLGNEPPWPNRENEFVGLVLDGKETPMQAALKDYLREGDTPERRKAFVYDTYAKYINTVNAAVKKHDPNHLNLGYRYGGSPPADLIKASTGFDVFSINIYGYTSNLDAVQKIYELTGMPVIIGEFHFGTPGRGMAPGLAQTKNQEERGAAYRYYVENAAAHPAIIGTHWFTWVDQPSTGRNDGENYNIGYVDVTDRPYYELVEAAKETHKRIFDIHSGKAAPTDRKALVQ